MSALAKLQDIDCEAALLANMLSSINAVNNAFDAIKVTDFVKVEHQKVFRAIESLFTRNQEISIYTVLDHLRVTDESFDPNYLLSISAFTSSGFGLYEIERLKKLSMVRSLAMLSMAFVEKLKQGGEEIEQIASTHLEEIEKILFSTGSDTRTIENVLRENYLESGMGIMDFIQHRMEMKEKGLTTFNGPASGHKIIDTTLNGLNNGHFIIVGARPAVGKTTFALNMIKNILKQGIPVGFFSLEMSVDEVITNILCMEAEVNSHRVRSFSLSPYEFHSLYEKEKQLQQLPLFVEDQGSLKISQLIARAKRMVKVNGVKAIFIDYLTLIEGDEKHPNNQEKVSVISKKLRNMAKLLNVPVICLCQLNRESEKDNRRPTKADLRESGQIEQDAHSIMLLHKFEDGVTTENARESKLHVYVEKNRFGPTPKVEFRYDKTVGLIKEEVPISELVRGVDY